MSTKTLRKRIALVAVSAMGFGLLSSVAANAAVATNLIANTNIASNAANGAAATVTTSPASNGLIANNGASTPAATAQTATMYSTGSLAIIAPATSAAAGGVAAVAQKISVSGGTVDLSANFGTNGGAITVAADKTSATTAVSGTTDGDTNRLVATVKPNSGVTSFTISGYADATAGVAASFIITVTVASTSVAGVTSVADSSVAFTAADGNAATTDVVGANSATSRTPLYLNVQLNDAYGNDITATSGALVVETSAGSLVGISAGTGAVGVLSSTSNSTLAVSTASPADINIRVQEATAGAGWAGTIKVTYNGVVIATKTGTIKGDVAKIVLTAKKILSNDGVATTGAFEYQAYDSAGNIVVLANGNLALSSSSNESVVSAIAGAADNSSTAAGTGTATGVNGAYGKSDVVIKTTLTSGVVVKSNAVTFNVAGVARSYKASFDKASYAQGDIAKLTIQWLDSKGNAANSVGAVSAATNQVISASQMDRVTAYTAAETPDSNGQSVYTFTVGTASGVTAGKYNAIVSYPTVNALDGANQSAAYTVTAASGVTNADVLAAIVKLIASINKQILALQKALKK